MDPLLEQFLQEARENLAFIDQNIEEIGSDDPELLNSVFRAAHTLKGGSGIVGFEAVKDITHHAEDLLDMLRAGKIDFQEGMTEALYDAFDEVMNLIEAAEESGSIVEADEESVKRIISALNAQMGKSVETQSVWQLPFKLASDSAAIINLSTKTLRNHKGCKIDFRNPQLDEEFVQGEHLYAITFDVDESCMVYGNDPIYTLSLLGEKVVGLYACMSDNNAKSVLSGMEDEEGLLLRCRIVAYIYATYEEIEDSLFNFIDELEFVPLDVVSLLGISRGDAGISLEVLKELAALGELADIDIITSEIERSMELIGSSTLQYAQLERFLDIASFIKESDVQNLASFFEEIYKGQVYTFNGEVSKTSTASFEVAEPIEADESEAPATQPHVELTPELKKVIDSMLQQQKKALENGNDEASLERIKAILETMRGYFTDMPASFMSAQDIAAFIAAALGEKASVVAKTPAAVVTPKKSEVAAASKVEVQAAAKPKEEVEILSQTITKSVPKEVVEEEDETQEDERPLKANTEREESKKAVVGKTVKIDQESIDSLMNVVGELLVAKNSLPYLADNVIGMTHEHIKREIMEKYIFINRLSEQLQDLIMSMRMLPISYVFDRYPKLVRDISKKLGKKVKLEMDGGNTKLDKNMIEMLADPMIHIMRNSLDHGIEKPEVREQKGKDPTGTVKLNAFAQSDRIIIEIIDDGAGINVDKVANKVLEKGLMTHEQIDALSEEEKAELVLLPGLSTADEISEYSGRGVGMDVVKKSIESFGGTIKIKTKANRGTVITLAIPVSLAVTSLLHILMNGIHYGIPMDSVSETVKIERDKIEYLHNEPFIYLRGEVIPLLFIKSMLDEKEMANEPLSIVVLNIKENLLAVVVNKFIGQLDVVQKPLVGILENHPLFSGTALLGNGQIIMAIDPLGLLGISQKLREEDIEVVA
ncbi:MAG: chemotaxis protein CheA [Epsilonproteobacteria bacterium]|nr:chemotaxis protein CheA [Campylobacterota bacterium]